MSDQLQPTLEGFDSASVTSVEEYQFEPIKGYPLLQWNGKRPFRSTHYYPAQLKEVHGPEVAGWRSKIYLGDNLQVMAHLLKTHRSKLQLVYIDPPFDSKAEYKKRIRSHGSKVESDSNVFEEKQYSDIWTNDEYLQFMYERLVLIRELLSESGSIMLHCDPKKSHHLRCLLDEVYGPSNFVNEIVWSYRRWPTNTEALQSMHDTILLYARAKSATRPFTKLYEDASDSYMKRFGGKTQVLDVETGTRKITSEEDTRGMPLRDVWDLSIVAGFKSERTGYPTQKPEELLERIVTIYSNPGDIVFDCFMGSGTTQAVAMRLGRRFIGADINLGAVQITTRRLIKVAKELEQAQLGATKAQTALPLGNEEEDEEALPKPTIFYTGFEVHNVNHYDIFRNPVEARDLLLEALEVQKLPGGNLFDGTRDGRLVKVMPVNRIATRADLNDLIANFDYKAFERRYADNPNKPVEKITLVCMGHEPDLASHLKREVHPYELDVEVFDVLRDGQHLQFKRDSEARVRVRDGWLTIEAFYPMNLLQKLSLPKESVDDWRELVESVTVDWNYDGAVLAPAVVDIPDRSGFVAGRYPVPEDAGTIRVKITDLLSESWEGEVSHG